MKLLLILSFSVIVLYAEENSTENRARFEKHLKRRLSRKLKLQSQLLKEEILAEVEKNLSKGNPCIDKGEDMADLKQDFDILKQAFHHLNTEVNVVKVKLEEAETANALMQKKFENLKKDFSNLKDNVEDAIEEGVSNVTQVNWKLANMSAKQATLQDRVETIAESVNATEDSLLTKMGERAILVGEAQRNMSAELNQRVDDLYDHVSVSILATVNNLRKEAINTLSGPVLQLQAVDTCAGKPQDEDSKGEKNGETEQRGIFVLQKATYTQSTSSVLYTIVNLKDNSKTAMNTSFMNCDDNIYPTTQVASYDPLFGRMFWVGVVTRCYDSFFGGNTYIKHVIQEGKARYMHKALLCIYSSRMVNSTIETKRLVCVNFKESVHAIAVDPNQGMIFYIEGITLKCIKTNGEDGKTIFPVIRSTFLTVDDGELIFAEKDRLLSTGSNEVLRLAKNSPDFDLKTRLEKLLLITPEEFSTCVYDTRTGTMYFDQGQNIMRVSKSKRTPTFVTAVPYNDWKLVHYFDSKLYISFMNSSSTDDQIIDTRCGIYDLRDSSFTNLL